jgi:hypothetical protein
MTVGVAAMAIAASVTAAVMMGVVAAVAIAASVAAAVMTVDVVATMLGVVVKAAMAAAAATKMRRTSHVGAVKLSAT